MACKLISEIGIDANAEKFHNLFTGQSYNVPKICQHVQAVSVHEGDWNSHGHGSIKIWNIIVDGKPEVFKEKVEYDDKNLSMTAIGLDGDVFKYYKSFKVIYQVVPKGPNHSLARLTIEYEKLREDISEPYKYIQMMNGVTRDIASHVMKA